MVVEKFLVAAEAALPAASLTFELLSLSPDKQEVTCLHFYDTPLTCNVRSGIKEWFWSEGILGTNYSTWNLILLYRFRITPLQSKGQVRTSCKTLHTSPSQTEKDSTINTS